MDTAASASGFYFSTCDQPGDYPCRLMRSDGGGTVELARNFSGKPSSGVLHLENALGDRFAFTASTDSVGSEPWISDGTPQGTRLLLDLNPTNAGSSTTFLGSFSSGSVLFGTYWFHAPNDGATFGSLVLLDGGKMRQLEGGPIRLFSPIGSYGGFVFLTEGTKLPPARMIPGQPTSSQRKTPCSSRQTRSSTGTNRG